MLLAQRVASIFLKFKQLDAALEALMIVRKGLSEPGPVYASLMQVVLVSEGGRSAMEGLAGLLGQLEPAERDQLLESIEITQVGPKLARDLAAHGEATFARASGDGTRLLALGVIAGAAHQPVLAEKALRGALQAQPDSLVAAVNLGEQLLAQCRWKDAIALAEPLTGRFKDSGAPYRVLGAAYDGLDDFKAAMTNLYESLRKDRRDTQAMWMAAQINDRLGQAEPASRIYEVLVTVKPDAWEAQIALVKNLLALRQKDAAVEHAGGLKEAFPGNGAAELCLLMARSGSAVPPAARIAELVKRHPGETILRQALGEAYLAEGEVDEAAEVLLAVLAEDPANEEARLLLTTALARQTADGGGAAGTGVAAGGTSQSHAVAICARGVAGAGGSAGGSGAGRAGVAGDDLGPGAEGESAEPAGVLPGVCGAAAAGD